MKPQERAEKCIRRERGDIFDEIVLAIREAEAAMKERCASEAERHLPFEREIATGRAIAAAIRALDSDA